MAMAQHHRGDIVRDLETRRLWRVVSVDQNDILVQALDSSGETMLEASSFFVMHEPMPQ